MRPQDGSPFCSRLAHHPRDGGWDQLNGRCGTLRVVARAKLHHVKDDKSVRVGGRTHGASKHKARGLEWDVGQEMGLEFTQCRGGKSYDLMEVTHRTLASRTRHTETY